MGYEQTRREPKQRAWFRRSGRPSRRTPAGRKARSGGSPDPKASLKLHALGRPRVCRYQTGKAESAQTIEDWRAKLPTKSLMPSTEEQDIERPSGRSRMPQPSSTAEELPAHLLAEIKIGTKAKSVAVGGAPAASDRCAGPRYRRGCLETEVDPEGDFGRLVFVGCGDRRSLLATCKRLPLSMFQIRNSRLMMPSSRKGKNQRAGHSSRRPHRPGRAGADIAGGCRPRVR